MPAPGERMLFPNGHLDTICLEHAGYCLVKEKFLLLVNTVEVLRKRFISITYFEE